MHVSICKGCQLRTCCISFQLLHIVLYGCQPLIRTRRESPKRPNNQASKIPDSAYSKLLYSTSGQKRCAVFSDRHVRRYPLISRDYYVIRIGVLERRYYWHSAKHAIFRVMCKRHIGICKRHYCLHSGKHAILSLCGNAATCRCFQCQSRKLLRKYKYQKRSFRNTAQVCQRVLLCTHTLALGLNILWP